MEKNSSNNDSKTHSNKEENGTEHGKYVFEMEFHYIICGGEKIKNTL